MLDMLVIVGIVVGLALASWLSYFIFSQILFIRNAKMREQQSNLKLKQLYEEKRTFVASSLKVISQALVEEQVGLVEASIRIKHLLGQLDTGLENDPELQVFFDVYEQTQHIPILENWKSLDRAIKQKHRSLIEGIEVARASEGQSAAMHLLKAL